MVANTTSCAPEVIYRSGYSYPRYGRYEHVSAHRDWRGDHRR